MFSRHTTYKQLCRHKPGFAVNIPPNILQNISMAIANTPHEGFKPVIGFKPNGEFILTFEPINP